MPWSHHGAFLLTHVEPKDFRSRFHCLSLIETHLTCYGWELMRYRLFARAGLPSRQILFPTNPLDQNEPSKTDSNPGATSEAAATSSSLRASPIPCFRRVPSH